MCSCDSSDGPSAFRSVRRKARKEHRCIECWKIVPPGAVYEYASGVWDGHGDSFKTCLRCVVLREAHVKAEEALQLEELEARWSAQRQRASVLMGPGAPSPPWYGRVEPCTVAFGTLIESIGECAREEGYVRHFRVARRDLIAKEAMP